MVIQGLSCLLGNNYLDGAYCDVKKYKGINKTEM